MTTDRRLADARSFGGLLAAVAAVLGVAPMLKHQPARPWLLGVALALATLSLAAPRAFVVPRRVWMAFGERLGRVTSPIVVALVYALAVVPVALVVRLRRRDLLGMRLDRARASYWVRREESGTDLTRQF
jgi:saxitoxin biosynthesis operon SxtJ-like protein